MSSSGSKGKEKGKASASASTSVPTEQSHTSQQRQDKENDNGQVDTSQIDTSRADTSLLSRIGASASGLARDTFVGEGARGDAIRRGVEGLVGGKGGRGSGSQSQEFGGGYAGGLGLREREREVGEGQSGIAIADEKGESIRAHIQRNEEEFSTFLDGVEGLDGRFGDGVDSMEFQDEKSGDSATGLKRDFETRDERNTRISASIESLGMLDITSESGGEERDRDRDREGGEYQDTSEISHSAESRDPHDSTSTPRAWEEAWSRASDISTPTSNPQAQRQVQRDAQSNIDRTVPAQNARPSPKSPTPQTDIPAQASHDGEDVLAILNARSADGELAEQEAMGREMEREMGRHGEEGYWEKIWGLDGEQRMKIVGIVRGLERGCKSNGLLELELVPDYEKEGWGGGREGGGEKWKSEWEGVLNGYVDEVWGGLLPLVKEARGELDRDRGREKERGGLKALRRLGVVLGHLRGGYGGGG